MSLYFEVGSEVSHAILLNQSNFFLTEPAKMVWGFYNGSLSYFITFPIEALQFYVKCV